ncbi:MAG: retroviral-like aspartic protease family protein [Ferruginibacter sp.]
MGLIYATIELTNQYDEYKNEEGLLPLDAIRRWSGEFMIDTGAIRMAINEDIKKKLGLKNGIMMNVSLADGNIKQVEMVGGIKVRFGDRTCYTDAFVLPDGTEPLLGAIPLEGMDLVVIPSENKLEYNPKHPDGALFSLK